MDLNCEYKRTNWALRRLRISQMRTDSCGPTFADDISGRQMRTTLADDRCGRQTRRTDKCGRQMRTDFLRTEFLFSALYTLYSIQKNLISNFHRTFFSIELYLSLKEFFQIPKSLYQNVPHPILISKRIFSRFLNGSELLKFTSQK